jgi:hypothetical protein
VRVFSKACDGNYAILPNGEKISGYLPSGCGDSDGLEASVCIDCGLEQLVGPEYSPYDFDKIKAFADLHSPAGGLARVVIAEGTTTISDEAYRDRHDVKEFVLPDSVVSIGESAFSGCSKLETINLPAELESIEEAGFWGCGKLTHVDLPKGLKYIGGGAFSYSGLTSVTLPEGLDTIEAETFLSCAQLTTVNFPKGLKSIGSCAFRYAPIAALDLPEGLEAIGECGFAECGISELKLPQSLKSIGEYSFHACKRLRRVCAPKALVEGKMPATEKKGKVALPEKVFKQSPVLLKPGGLSAPDQGILKAFRG